MKSHSGFSLIELLISAIIMLILFAMVFTAFIQTRKISLRNHIDAEIIQNARIGVDEMVRTMRMIGYRRDRENEQVALIEAAPFQVIFNADLDDTYKALTSTAVVKLYDATVYSPSLKYATGAETVRWTLDSSDDGIVDTLDTNDNAEERETARNPNDMALIKEINGGYDRQITLGVLGPYNVNDQPTYITPMFQYWLLDSIDKMNDTYIACQSKISSYSTYVPYTTFFLLGDTNCDGRLEGNERYFRSITSQVILKKVRRIQITLTAESDQKDPIGRKQHRKITLSSEISPRNIE